MTGWRRFWIGGGGALLPLLVTMLAVDLASVIDHRGEYSLGIYIGAGIRYLILFVVGGIVAALNSDEIKPIKLVQLGIAAPALIASYVNAQPLKIPPTTPTPAHTLGPGSSLSFISPAYGIELREHSDRIVIAGFLSDVYRGATNSLPAIGPAPVIAPAIDKSPKLDSVDQRELMRAIEDTRKSAADSAEAADRAAADAERAATQPSADATSAAKQSASDASIAAQKANASVKALEKAADPLTNK